MAQMKICVLPLVIVAFLYSSCISINEKVYESVGGKYHVVFADSLRDKLHELLPDTVHLNFQKNGKFTASKSGLFLGRNNGNWSYVENSETSFIEIQFNHSGSPVNIRSYATDTLIQYSPIFAMKGDTSAQLPYVLFARDSK